MLFPKYIGSKLFSSPPAPNNTMFACRRWCQHPMKRHHVACALQKLSASSSQQATHTAIKSMLSHRP